jgi:hypothetical protein
MDTFLYPGAAHARRHGPRGYLQYESYKPWLRDEFSFRCVYCLCRERWFPDGEAAFAVDHVQPQSTAPELRNEYDNLVYSCCQCNALRAATAVLDPCQHAYGQQIRVLESGLVEALTPAGTELIEICRLNRPPLVAFRRGMIQLLNFLRERKGMEAQALLDSILGFPVSLPNLAQLKPPGGNSRPDGIPQSYIERKNRGQLTTRY